LHESGGHQDLQHDVAVFVLDREQDCVVDSGFTGVGEGPLCGGACDAIKTAGALAIERVESRSRRSRTVDLRIIPTLGVGQVFQMELVPAVPVDFQAVGLVGPVAVQLETVSDPRADRRLCAAGDRGEYAAASS